MSKEKTVNEEEVNVEVLAEIEKTTENLIIIDVENKYKFYLLKNLPLDVEKICKEIDAKKVSNNIYILNEGKFLIARKKKGSWNVDKGDSQYIKSLMIGGSIVNIDNIKEEKR